MVPRAVGALLPLTAIVAGLTMRNLHRVVFDVMGGLGPPAHPHDQAYGLLLNLTFAAVLGFVPLLIAWSAGVVRASQRPA